MANLKVLAGATITFAMPDGLKITWTSENDIPAEMVLAVRALLAPGSTGSDSLALAEGGS